jgi:hypothetical protein
MIQTAQEAQVGDQLKQKARDTSEKSQVASY